MPYFYRDFDDLSAENIRLLDEDYSKVRDAVRRRFPERPFKYMLSYLDLERLTHTSENFDIKKSLKESKQLASIKTPTVETHDGKRALDINSRFFTDDIPYGVLICKWIAEELNVETPFIDELIQWSQTLRDEKFLTDDGKIDLDFSLRDKYTSGISSFVWHRPRRWHSRLSNQRQRKTRSQSSVHIHVKNRTRVSYC